MALRVLLADESATIKKVFQLSLQDYAVEVMNVTVGTDVLPLVQKFKPDIVFVDVLLPKKSGYDVCAELKNSPELRDIPVVVVWSGFMDLDEDKLHAAGADAKLEKPFDAKQLRQTVQSLVPQTKSNPLSQFLAFPDLPAFEDRQPALPPEPASEEEFVQVPLVPPATTETVAVADSQEEPEEKWVQKSIQDYREDLADLASEPDSPEPAVSLPDLTPPPPLATPPPATPPQAAAISFDPTGDPDALELDFGANPNPPAPLITLPAEGPSTPPVELSREMIEQLVHQELKEQVRETIESVVWKVVPELATQIIERELKRLLGEKGGPSRAL